MAFAFVQSNSAGDSSGSSVASIAVSLTGVGANNLIANWVKHESATTTISDSDGTTTLSTGTYVNNPPSNSHGQWQYLLTANSGNKTYTSTFGASRDFPSTIIFEYSYTGTASLDDQSTSNGTSTAVSSGNFTTTGTDGVAFGGYAENNSVTTSSEQVNGVAADGAVRSPAGNFTSAWRKTYSAGFTGAATATLGSSEQWACAGIAFKAVSTLEINAGVGSWTWAGSQAAFQRGPETAFQQNAFQSNAFQIFGGTLGGGGVTTVNATPGAWTWAGSTATTTQLINAGVGAWTWAGNAATTTQLINAGVGAWTWAGAQATTTQLINASPGAWTWAGTQASFAGATEVNATPGAWSWAGSQAEIPTMVAATPGAWNWAGAQASTTQLINAGIGAFSWAGSQSSFSQLINATPGAWNWAGTQSEIIQFITIDATVGLWDWTGTQASFSSQATDQGAGSPGVARNARKYKKRFQIEIDGEVFEVRSESEAVQILETLRDEAQRVAQATVQRANRMTRRPKRKILSDARRALKPPEITTNRWVSDFAESIAREIREVYQDALKTIEIGTFLRKLEDDDDEDILVLIL